MSNNLWFRLYFLIIVKLIKVKHILNRKNCTGSCLRLCLWLLCGLFCGFCLRFGIFFETKRKLILLIIFKYYLFDIWFLLNLDWLLSWMDLCLLFDWRRCQVNGWECVRIRLVLRLKLDYLLLFHCLLERRFFYDWFCHFLRSNILY